MTDWTPEELARVSAAHLRCVRLCQARQAPRATTETRIALVAFERGLTDRHLEQFYYVNRKGAKKRYFDHEAFAKKYGVDIHWLWDGAEQTPARADPRLHSSWKVGMLVVCSAA
jgi:hypothetical protein